MTSETTEWAVRVYFKKGNVFQSARMSEDEARELISQLTPSDDENQSIREVQLLSYRVTEEETLVSRRPVWGTL